MEPREPKIPSIFEAIDRWREHCLSRPKGHYKHRRAVVSHLAESLPKTVQTVDQLDKTHIEYFIALLLRQHKTSTLIVYVSAIRIFLQWLSIEYGTPLITVVSKSSPRQRRTHAPKILPVLKVKGNPDTNVLEEWLLYIGGLSENTKLLYKRMVLNLISKSGYKTVDELEPLEIRNYINKLLSNGLKKSSLNNTVTAFRSFGQFLAETYTIPNPCANLKKFRVSSYHQPFITHEQYDRILASATRRQFDVIQFLAHTGLRATELANLKYENIIDNFSKLRFVGKGDKVRTIPLNDIAREILRRNCNGEKLFILTRDRRNTHRMCKRAGKNAGGIHLAPHMLRRFFGSELVHAGVSLLIVSKLLGHASLQTTERYLKCDSSYLNGATDILALNLLQESSNCKMGGA